MAYTKDTTPIVSREGWTGKLPLQYLLPPIKQLAGLKFAGQDVYKLSKKSEFSDEYWRALIAHTNTYVVDLHPDGRVEVYDFSLGLWVKCPPTVLPHEAKYNEQGNLEGVVLGNSIPISIETTRPDGRYQIVSHVAAPNEKESERFRKTGAYLWGRFVKLEESVRKLKEEPLIQSELEKLRKN